MDRLRKFIICMVFIFSLKIGGDCKAVKISEINKDCITPNDRVGQCIPIQNCEQLSFLFQNFIQTPIIALFLNDSMCGYDGEHPKVCCPLSNELTTTTETSQTTSTPKMVLKNHNDCGRPYSTKLKVSGGQEAELGAWPWIALLGYRHMQPEADSETLWHCGGSLISHRYVITNAHCTLNFGMYILTVVRLGELNLNATVDDGASPIDVVISEIKSHELYDPKSYDYNIALLKLENSITFTPLLCPICLPVLQEHSDKIMVMSKLYVAGWCFREFATMSEPLMEVQVPIIDILDCKNENDHIKTIINTQHLCVGKTGKDSCRGYSGGPLILQIDSQYYLVGIVNFGPDDNRSASGYPGVYTRVTSFIEWISNNTNST